MYAAEQGAFRSRHRHWRCCRYQYHQIHFKQTRHVSFSSSRVWLSCPFGTVGEPPPPVIFPITTPHARRSEPPTSGLRRRTSLHPPTSNRHDHCLPRSLTLHITAQHSDHLNHTFSSPHLPGRVTRHAVCCIRLCSRGRDKKSHGAGTGGGDRMRPPRNLPSRSLSEPGRQRNSAHFTDPRTTTVTGGVASARGERGDRCDPHDISSFLVEGEVRFGFVRFVPCLRAVTISWPRQLAVVGAGSWNAGLRPRVVHPSGVITDVFRSRVRCHSCLMAVRLEGSQRSDMQSWKRSYRHRSTASLPTPYPTIGTGPDYVVVAALALSVTLNEQPH